MALNDVWRSIAVGYFYEATFDKVPFTPGVYAWFYPLRVLSRQREALISTVTEVQKLLCYDAGVKGCPGGSSKVQLSWSSWELSARIEPDLFELTDKFITKWDQIIADDGLFSEFQKALLKASILMPPLYVGKANNLNIRCGQHQIGTGKNDFHDRFQNFADQHSLSIRSVRKLIFGCVQTGPFVTQNENEFSSPVHELVEAIMKSVCSPPYGVR